MEALALMALLPGRGSFFCSFHSTNQLSFFFLFCFVFVFCFCFLFLFLFCFLVVLVDSRFASRCPVSDVFCFFVPLLPSPACAPPATRLSIALKVRFAPLFPSLTKKTGERKKQNKTKQNKTKQNKTKQNKANQLKTKQNKNHSSSNNNNNKKKEKKTKKENKTI